MKTSSENRLATASSPYLRQHANNPVNWYPWGKEAFEKAQQEQKPIFLSIGYSTCHWCHVMAHESFEDPLIARLLNEHFVAIKVDREERPDVDRLYMSYVQSLTGSGGWPLSLWLTPSGKPFFGGTYFPPRGTQGSYGRVGLDHMLEQLITLWEQERDKLEKEGERNLRRLEVLLQKESRPAQESSAIVEILERASKELLRSFDPQNGGFGGAPKFPQPSRLLFLSREVSRLQAGRGKKDPNRSRRSQEIEEVFLATLDKMASGGIYDHLGGGFHRYSVDASWMVPHFEKMLYDQAQLALLYLEGWQMKPSSEYRKVIEGICDYVLVDLQHLDGAFYAAEDADSWEEKEKKKREGAFYCWEYRELEELLSKTQLALLSKLYHLQPAGNIPPAYDPHDEMKGKNILHRVLSLQEIDDQLGPEALAKRREGEALLKEAHAILLAARSQRPRPHRDEKIVTAWNGMMISALAKAGSLLGRSDYLEAAIRAATFLQQNLYQAKEKKLLRSWSAGNITPLGFAEDYTSLMVGLLDLYQATGTTTWLEWAEELHVGLEDHFWDEDRGGYLGSQVGADPYLLLDLQEEYDGAEPSATSMAAIYLQRWNSLWESQEIMGEPKKRAMERFDQILLQRGNLLEQMPTALTQFLIALEERELPSRQLVIVGKIAQHREKIMPLLDRGFSPQQRNFLFDLEQPEQKYKYIFERTPLFRKMWEQAKASTEEKKENKKNMGLLFLCEYGVCHPPEEI